MKKYYWLIVGAIIGFITAMLSYSITNAVAPPVLGQSFNWTGIAKVVAGYTVLLFIFGYIYENVISKK